MWDKIGVTRVVPPNQDAIPVYETEGGIPVFETDEPYLLLDTTSLEDPPPIVVVEGPWAIAVTGLDTTPLWTPADLFSPGQAGYWPDTYAPDRGRVFGDTASTVPAVNPGDRVAVAGRRIGEADAIQSVLNYRVHLGRYPITGRTNLARSSEDLTTGWVYAAATAPNFNTMMETVQSGNHHSHSSALSTLGTDQVWIQIELYE